MNFLYSLPAPSLKNYRLYLSLVLGAGFGLFVYSYWLIDILPPVGKQIIVYTALASLVGAAGYFLLLELWISPGLSEMRKLSRWTLLASSLLAGVLLLFIGTSAWKSPARYITFLLPQETLRISAPAEQTTIEPEITILRFTTSLGDVSYNTLDSQGWARNGYELTIKDLSNNRLTWAGRAGEQAQIVFRRSPRGGMVNISWNGESRTINLSSEQGNKYLFKHYFDVPFYASRAMVLLLGVLNFFVLCCAINLFLWKRRETILESYRELISSVSLESHDGAAAKKVVFDWAAMIGIVVAALLLRVFNLENLLPYTDEYAHLIAARQLLEGIPLNAVYQRSLFIVTLPAALFLRSFGMELWAARLPGVLFNSLAVVPLYMITRKINRPAAVLSCALYATSPWIIAVARNVREYAYYPFYFYWIIYGMVRLIESFPDRFVILRDWKKVFKAEFGFWGAALILPALYGMVVDPTSTLKVVLIAYIVCGLFLLGKFDFRNKQNLLLIVAAGAVVLTGGYIYMMKQSLVSILPGFNGYPLRYFFTNPQQQWYFDRLAIVPVIALWVAIPASLFLYRANFLPSFLLALYLVFVLFFTLFFSRYIRPRYIISAQYWYIPLMALGLYGIFTILQLILPPKWIVIPLIISFLGALMFNGSQILLPTFYSKQGYMPITEEIHYNVGPAYSFLLGRVKSGDVLISTVYSGYVSWKGAPGFQKVYQYDYRIEKPREYIFSIVEQYDSGWVVLDTRRYSISKSKPLPKSTIVLNNKKIEYVGLFSDQYIWRWITNEPP